MNRLREQFNLPGMSVLQFAFDGFADNPHKPKNVTEGRVYYTGTHDNDTAAGWFAALKPTLQADVMKVLGIQHPDQVAHAMVSTVLASHAELAVAPLQDLLGLDSSARMNTPGTTEHNWQWRFEWQQLPIGLAAELHQQLEQTGRLYHA